MGDQQFGESMVWAAPARLVSGAALLASALLAVALTLPVPRATAAEVGRVDLNGRTVILDSDRSWKFADEVADSAGDCTSLSSAVFPVKFCLEEAGWQRDKEGDSFELLFTSKSDDLYFGVISERVYLDSETLKSAILDNARGAAGLKGLTKTAHTTRELNGHDWTVTELHLEIGSTPIIFENYNTSIEGVGSVQMVFWSEASAFDRTAPEREKVANTLTIVK